VEHALSHPSPSGPGHPWRTIAVVASGIAALELLVLAIVGIAVLAKPMAKRAAVHAARAAAAPSVTKKPAAPTRPILSRGAVSVTVLNGNGVSGAAAAEASRVRARGYKIGVVGNAPRGGYGRSIVMYRAGLNREGSRLAHDLGIGIASPLDGLRRRDLHGAKLAVVIGG
jgi:LytR cell envelope-related transcriptional attenuator